MNKETIYIILRFVIIIAFQVLVLKRVQFSEGVLSYGHLFLYPVLIFILPLKIQRSIVLIIAFFTGLAVDMFYDSPGVHTATLLVTAYARSIVMRVLSPYEGYKTKDNPSIRDMGFTWVLVYTALLLLIHLFTYFSIEAFSAVFIFEIVMRTIFSFILSYGVILLYQIIFRPKS